MLIYELLELKEKDIVSIVGAGGKTTLMFQLANELKNHKVLVTTTTKIYKPKEEEIKHLALRKDGYEYLQATYENGIYVYGNYVNNENKLVGLDLEELNYLKDSFKYILIESDGSKNKSLKAWNEYEPVIYQNTNKTIGVLSLNAFGMTINDENIHRLKEFIYLTNSKLNEKVSFDILISIIFGENGLFKNSKGERILFLNAADIVNENVLNLLINKIIEKNNDLRLINKIIYGSLKYKYLDSIKL